MRKAIKKANDRAGWDLLKGKIYAFGHLPKCKKPANICVSGFFKIKSMRRERDSNPRYSLTRTSV